VYSKQSTQCIVYSKQSTQCIVYSKQSTQFTVYSISEFHMSAAVTPISRHISLLSVPTAQHKAVPTVRTMKAVMAVAV